MPVGVFDTGREVADYFNMSVRSFYCAITRKVMIKQRFIVEKVDLELTDEDLQVN